MYICMLFLLFGYVFVFSLSFLVVFAFLFCWCRGSCTHNEDIVPFRCGGGESRSCFLQKVFKIQKKNSKKKIFLWVFGSSVLYLIDFKPRKLDY